MLLFTSTIFNRPALAFLHTFALLLYFCWSFRPFLSGWSSQAKTAIVYSGRHYGIMPVGDHGFSTVTHEYTHDQLFSLRQPRVIDQTALTRIRHLGIQLRPPERVRRYRARGRSAGARVQHNIIVVSRGYNSKPRDITERKHNVKNLTSQPLPRRSANIVEPVTRRHTGCIERLFRCGTLNVRSINNKVVAVKDLLKENINLLRVTETWHEDAEASCIKQTTSFRGPAGARAGSADTALEEDRRC